MLLRKVSQSPALRGTILRVSPVLYGYVKFTFRLLAKKKNIILLYFLLKNDKCLLFSVYTTEVSVPPLPKAFGYMLAKPRYCANRVL